MKQAETGGRTGKEEGRAQHLLSLGLVGGADGGLRRQEVPRQEGGVLSERVQVGGPPRGAARSPLHGGSRTRPPIRARGGGGARS
jgi:hypothetical protein